MSIAATTIRQIHATAPPPKRSAPDAGHEAIPSARALVPMDNAPASPQPANGAAETATRGLGRPHAPYLAQLVATAAHVPQTRSRSRIDPAAGVAAYQQAARQGTMPASSSVSCFS